MDIPAELIVGVASVFTFAGAGVVLTVKAVVGWWMKRKTNADLSAGAGDREVRLLADGQAHIAKVPRLEAASVHERADAALKAGADACMALARELSAEAAREECASCTALRRELTRIQDARIDDLRELLPALAKSSASMDSAAQAITDAAEALRNWGGAP